MSAPQVIYFVVMLVLSIALAPKPPKRRPAALEDFDVPTADEARPIPVVFGEVHVTGPNVVWYGQLFTKRLKKSSLFGSTTVGFAYYLGLHFVICQGPIDSLSRIVVGEKLAWEGDLTESDDTILIDKRKLFGGSKQEGGLFGLFDYMDGSPDQEPNAYLEAVTENNPAYRGVASVVWRAQDGSGIQAQLNTEFGIVDGKQLSGLVGQSPYVKPWAFTVTRLLKGWENDEVWYPEKAVINENEMNPAHIIYEALTNSEWGMGRPASVLDLDNFAEVADTLFDEGFGLRMIWNRESTIDSFLEIILDHIGGGLSFNRTTGKYQLTLIRADYDPEDLPIFDESNITNFRSFQRQLWGETSNEVTVMFTDPETFKTTSVTAHDIANIQTQSARINQKVSYPGIYNPEIAAKVAMRELANRSTPLAKVSIETTRAAWEQVQGGVIKISWARLGLVEVVFRILTIRGGTLKDSRITIELIEDIFGLPVSSYITPENPPDFIEPEEPEFDVEDDANSNNVVSTTVNTPPSTPADGDRYLVPLSPPATGDWTGFEGLIVEWDATLEAWIPSAVPGGQIIFDEDTGQHVTTGNDGSTTSAPWTPEIPPLIDQDPDAGDHIPFFDVSANDYRKVDVASLVGPKIRTIGAHWTGGGGSLSTPIPDVSVRCPFNGEIIEATLLGEGSGGSCVVDIWKASYTSYPPNVSDTITASAKPTLSSADKYSDTTLAGWTKTITAGQVLTFHLESVADLTELSIQLTVRETY